MWIGGVATLILFVLVLFKKMSNRHTGLIGTYSSNKAACPKLADKFARSAPHLFRDGEVSIPQSEEDEDAMHVGTHLCVKRTPQQAIQGLGIYGPDCVCSSNASDAVGRCSICMCHPCGTVLPRLICCGSVRLEDKRG